MSRNVWPGAVYLRDEGGYDIVLKALNHYKKRLRTLAGSPELRGAAAMFASVLNQQAARTVPRIDGTILRVRQGLEDTALMSELKEDAPFLLNALECYRADINKAMDTGDDYFVRLIGNVPLAAGDLAAIDAAVSAMGNS